jgi:signal peptidase I
MNLALIMFLLLVSTGGVWAAERFALRRRREAAAAEIAAQARVNYGGDEARVREAYERAAQPPWWIEYPVSFFPVILVVFVLRSFLFEPFKIPSGSMIPTLLVGDFIVVNKYTYGIRLPVINVKVFGVGSPQHGDVMVFRYPEDPSLDYIKRVVGLPGDRLEYRDRQLILNGVPVPQQEAGEFSYVEGGLQFITAQRRRERLGATEHEILVQLDLPPIQLGGVRAFPLRELCHYNERGFVCTVPPGHYFTMGDNRDASSDSRYWGFVPDRNIVGRAVMIWWNFDAMSRIGTRIQ